MERAIIFPNVEAMLKRMIPGYKSIMSYRLADGVNINQLNQDEKYLLGIH